MDKVCVSWVPGRVSRTAESCWRLSRMCGVHSDRLKAAVGAAARPSVSPVTDLDRNTHIHSLTAPLQQAGWKHEILLL